MRRDIKLFINNQRVDLSEDTTLNMTYQITDLTKPSAVKNNFSKTITLRGTKANNAVFGYIYRMDRNQQNDGEIGVNFNPNKRVPFSLYINNDLWESGYMQLSKVIKENNEVKYEINLFGGLGDFFYEMATKENGESKSLSDLNYFEGGDDELNITVNASTVSQNFTQGWSDTVANKNQFIRFVPSKNGVYEDFNNDKVLILSDETGTTFFQKTITEDTKTYGSLNGYLLGNIGSDMDEWDIGSLRSYKQRPSVRVNHLMTKIMDSTEYTVNKDSAFFNTHNPWWNDTVMALPLLGSNVEDNTEMVTGRCYNDSEKILGHHNQHLSTSSATYTVAISGTPTGSGNIIDVSRYPSNAQLTVQYTFQLFYNYIQKAISGDPTNPLHLYLGARYNNGHIEGYFKNSIDAYIRVITTGGTEITRSQVTRMNGTSTEFIDTGLPQNNVVNYCGSFTYHPGYHRYIYVRNEGNQKEFPLVCTVNAIGTENLKVELVLKWNSDSKNPTYGILYPSEESNYYTQVIPWSWYKGYSAFVCQNNYSPFQISYNPSQAATNMVITKDRLLSTDKTPLDYLLSYTKAFNLMWLKDKYDKKVSVMTMNKFYTGKVMDWTQRIDNSKKIEIKPSTSDSQFYELKWGEKESYLSKRYKEKYKSDYGRQKVNTNYQFNGETTQLFDDTVYDNAIDLRDRTKYNFTKVCPSTAFLPYPCYANTMKVTYFYTGDTTDTKEIDVNTTNITTTIGKWSNTNGYDNKILPCFFTKDNDEKSLADINSTLLFYNGMVDDKHAANLRITDDTSLMYQLADGPCHLIVDKNTSNSGTSTSTESTVAPRLTQIPQFSRVHYTVNNRADYSLNFGLPRENFTLMPEYDDNTIYKNYWSSYFTDMYDENSKILTAYFRLDGLVVGYELMRNFVFIMNSVWRINKISDYNIMSDDTVKVELVKVNDIGKYLGASKQFD